jgi:hypothetical protein
MSNANELVWEDVHSSKPRLDRQKRTTADKKTLEDKIHPHRFKDGALMTQIAARKDKAIDMDCWKVMEVTKFQDEKWVPVKKSDWANTAKLKDPK